MQGYTNIKPPEIRDIVVHYNGWWKEKPVGLLTVKDYISGQAFTFQKMERDELNFVDIRKGVLKVVDGLNLSELRFKSLMDGILLDVDTDKRLLSAWDLSDVDEKWTFHMFMECGAAEMEQEPDPISTPVVYDVECNEPTQLTQCDEDNVLVFSTSPQFNAKMSSTTKRKKNQGKFQVGGSYEVDVTEVLRDSMSKKGKGLQKQKQGTGKLVLDKEQETEDDVTKLPEEELDKTPDIRPPKEKVKETEVPIDHSGFTSEEEEEDPGNGGDDGDYADDLTGNIVNPGNSGNAGMHKIHGPNPGGPPPQTLPARPNGKGKASASNVAPTPVKASASNVAPPTAVSASAAASMNQQYARESAVAAYANQARIFRDMYGFMPDGMRRPPRPMNEVWRPPPTKYQPYRAPGPRGN